MNTTYSEKHRFILNVHTKFMITCAYMYIFIQAVLIAVPFKF